MLKYLEQVLNVPASKIQNLVKFMFTLMCRAVD